MIDAEVRKCGYQTGLDTLVVRTVNDGYLLLMVAVQHVCKIIDKAET